MTITAETLHQFLAYAEDAGNWGGTPWVDGNINFGKAGRGHLTQMKKAGLLVTEDTGEGAYIIFTEAGKALALEHGIKLY